MTDKETEDFYDEMLKFFGKLPDFEHEPIQFAYKVKIYKLIMEQKTHD